METMIGIAGIPDFTEEINPIKDSHLINSFS